MIDTLKSGKHFDYKVFISVDVQELLQSYYLAKSFQFDHRAWGGTLYTEITCIE